MAQRQIGTEGDMNHTSSEINEAPVKSTGRKSDQFPLRLPDGMRQELKIRAASNRRTMNAEMLCLIEAGMAATATQAHAVAGAA